MRKYIGEDWESKIVDMDIRNIPITEDIALRGNVQPGIRKDGVNALVTSFKINGIIRLHPVILKQKIENPTSAEHYEIIDGLHRQAACIQLGIDKFPVIIIPWNTSLSVYELRAISRGGNSMHDQWAVHETEFERMIQVAQYGNEKDFIAKT